MTTLLVLLCQSTVLLALGLLALRLTRRRGPAVQTLVGRATLCGVGLLVLLLPLSGRVRPVWRIPTPVRPSPALPKREGAEVQPVGAPRDAPSAAPAPSAVPAPSASSSAVPADPPLPVPISASGAASSVPTPPTAFSTPRPPASGGPLRSKEVGLPSLLLLLWLAVCRYHLIRLRRAARLITSGPAAALLAELTPHPPLLLTHPSVHSPFLAGTRRPAIFLPPTFAADFGPDALRAVFLHELAHRDRRDNLWTLAARVLTALLWFQPLLWLLNRRLEQISEDACDQAVLAAHCPPRAYAACLLSLAERPPLARSQRTLTAGVAPFRSSIGRRISRILTLGVPIMPAVTLRLRLSIAALTVAAATGGAFLVSSAPAQQTIHTSPWQPVASNPKFPLVGMWLYHAQPIGGNKDDGIVVYRPDSRIEYVFPHQVPLFGTYTVKGDKLQELLQTNAAPNRATKMQFQIIGYTLCVRDGTGEVSFAQRVPEVKQGTLMQKVLGGRNDAASDIVMFAPGNIRVHGTLNDKQHALQISAASNAQLDQAQFLAGLTPVQGPGVVVTLRDSKKLMPTGMPAGMPPPNIIHDSDINQVVNELKAAGAEAIAVNSQRLVATSAVRSAGPTVYVNNTAQAPPFVIQAIGDPKILAGALSIPGGIASQIAVYDKAMFTVQQAATLTLPAYAGKGEMHYAKPVSAADVPALPAPPFEVIVTLDDKGSYFLDGVQLPESQIEPFLAARARQNPNLTAVIKAATNQPYSRVVKLLDLAKQAGIHSFFIAPPASSGAQSASLPSALPKRSFVVNFWVPSTGTHAVQVYVIDATGRHLASAKAYGPGTKVNLPVQAVGRSVSFQIYDNGRLTKTQQIASGSAAPAPSIALRVKDLTQRLATAQEQLAAEQTTHALINQQLVAVIHATMPDSPALVQAKALNLEKQIPESASKTAFWKAKKQASQKSGDSRNAARYGHYAAMSSAHVRREAVEEGELFPKTAKTHEALSTIHSLAEKADNERMTLLNAEVSVEDYKDMLRVDRAVKN